MKMGIIVTTIFLLLGTSFVSAEVPNQINYQGYLTDAVGDPVADGGYLVKFIIYDAPVGGTDLWNSGFQNVITENGVFSYLLGSNVSLPDGIFADSNRYLGITVGADPEITPRSKFNSAAFAFTAQNLSGDLLLYDSNDTLRAAGLPNSGGYYMYGTNGMNYGQMYCFTWGEIFLRDNDGDYTVDLGASNSIGGFLSLNDPIDGTGNIYLIAGGNGNTTVNLPDDAIDKDEILDEPGIVQGIDFGQTGVNTTMADIVTVSITIPEPGYVVLEANAQAGIYGTTSSNFISFQIDKTAGGSIDTDHYQNVGMNTPPNTGIYYFPVYSKRTYFENSSGTFTYRFEALGTASGTKYLWNSNLTAVYYPTSYGTVTTIAPTPPEGVDATFISGQNQDGTPMQSYKYDLRQLELEAKEAALKAKEAELRLLKAQQQQNRNNVNK